MDDSQDTFGRIAVIGMACRFPGADNPRRFWENLRAGLDSIRSFDDAELDEAGVPQATREHDEFVNAGAVIEDATCFDADFFGFSATEAAYTDPQLRVFLETSWHALEDAGYDPGRYPGRIGLFGGMSMSTYIYGLTHRAGILNPGETLQARILNDKDFLTTWTAYKLDLKGPCVNVGTACSTSLVATHLACQSLLNGEADMALAGGVTLNTPQKTGYRYVEGGINAPDGKCRAFDAEAKGTVIGNGAGLVVLKRLEDALADGDHIEAVILGSAINNDGAGKLNFTAPSLEGQKQVIAEALAMADISADSIGMVEAHGTGTPLGDPTEITALSEVYRRHGDETGTCAVGSVKTNIGHLDAAAGVAGLIKTTLAVKHGEIPASLNFKQANPEINFAESPFYVNSETRAWSKPVRRAALSSFGVGGTNAHCIVENAPVAAPSSEKRDRQLLLLSARNEAALERQIQQYQRFFEQTPAVSFADAAYTSQVGRAGFSLRAALVAEGPDQAVSLLAEGGENLLRGTDRRGKAVACFMFPGQGSQVPSMAFGLYQKEPAFRQRLDRCFGILLEQHDLDLKPVLFADDERLNQTHFTQPAMFAVCWALADWLIDLGIQPESMIGHSVGEYVAACLAGVFQLEDVLKLVVARGRLMAQLAEGPMLLVALPVAELEPILPKGWDIAVINTRDQTVAAGPNAGLNELTQQLDARGISYRRLKTSHAFHSSCMDPILNGFKDLVASIPRSRPTVPFIANLTGTWITEDQAVDPGYWAAHLRGTVQFAKGLTTLLEEQDRVLIEVGPGRALCGFARRLSTGTPGLVSLLAKGTDQDQTRVEAENHAFTTGLARLWLNGLSPDWQTYHAGYERRRVSLPTYPFAREPYSLGNGLQAGAAHEAGEATRKPMQDWAYTPGWRRGPAPTHPSGAPESWLVFADDAGLAEPLIAALQKQQHRVIRVEAGETFVALREDVYAVAPGLATDLRALIDALQERDSLPGRIVFCWGNDADSDHQSTPASRFDTAMTRGVTTLLLLTKALVEAGVTKPLQIDCPLHGAFTVLGHETPRPETAPLAAACKIIPLEFPQFRCRVIDLAEHNESAVTRTLVNVLQQPAEDAVVALRGRFQWLPDYQPLALTESNTHQLQRGGVYVLTGGLGALGLVLARHLAEHYAAKLVLLSRSAPVDGDWAGPESQDQPRREALQALEQAAGGLLLLRADCADPDQLQGALQQAQQHFGRINGILHLAGLPGGGLIRLKTAETLQATLAAKARGAALLFAWLQQQPPAQRPDFLMLFASLSGVIGEFGQVDYAAANSYLDALAQRAAVDNLPVLAVDWDGWREEGMLARAQAPAGLEHIHAAGLRNGLSNAEGIAVFERALGLGQPQVVLSTTALQPRLTDRANADDVAAALRHAAPGQGHQRPDLETVYLAPRDELEQAIAAVFSDLLGFEQIGVHDNFFDLGGNSLLGISLVNHFQTAFGEIVHITAMMDAPTIALLAAYFEKHYPLGVAKMLGRKTVGIEDEDESPIDEALAQDFAATAAGTIPSPFPEKNPNAAFVLSAPRTGSTLLRVLLAGNAKLFAPPELDLLSFDRLRDRQAGSAVQENALTEGATIALKEGFGLDTAAAEAETARLEQADMTVAAFYRHLQAGIGDRLLVEKSPGYALKPAILDRIENGFSEPRYIHLTRHPYAMIHSYEEAKLDLLLSSAVRERFPLSRRRLAELTWLISERNLAAFFAKIPAERVHLVRFEDLLADPENALRRICTFLGVPFQLDMLEPYREKQQRMTRGLRPQSRMIGDVKFHSHHNINGAVADQWRNRYQRDFLGAPTIEVAARLGYTLIAEDAEALHDIRTAPADPAPAVDPLAGLDEAALAGLSEAELDALLTQAVHDGGLDRG